MTLALRGFVERGQERLDAWRFRIGRRNREELLEGGLGAIRAFCADGGGAERNQRRQAPRARG